jgi:hypothetical protein
VSQKRAVSLSELLPQPIQGIQTLKETFGDWVVHPSQHVDPDQVHAVLGELVERLDADFPYFHPQTQEIRNRNIVRFGYHRPN